MKINLEILNASYLIDEKEIQTNKIKELVPKMVFRRRLTKASKIFIELMNNVEFSKGRIMYASAFGELNATANILNSILNKQLVSPTDFQNSVYNTPVSYASILHENSSELLTVSSGDNTSQKLLKLGAIKALDGDEILLVAIETLNIENIEEVNNCIDFLECGVALKVKYTQEEANMNLEMCSEKISNSLKELYYIAKYFNKNSKNIISVEI